MQVVCDVTSGVLSWTSTPRCNLHQFPAFVLNFISSSGMPVGTFTATYVGMVVE